MKKILVLNGSPRPNGNTSALIDAFVRGAEEAGNEVARIDLRSLDIRPCLGCCKGGKDPESPCVQKDGMLSVYPAYKASDVVVLASPLYYWSVSGMLKTAFDRLFSVAECDANLRNTVKSSLLLMAAEGYGFEESEYWYDRLMERLGWTSLGKVLCGHCGQRQAPRGLRAGKEPLKAGISANAVSRTSMYCRERITSRALHYAGGVQPPASTINSEKRDAYASRFSFSCL